jgi:hypothetical protein
MHPRRRLQENLPDTGETCPLLRGGGISYTWAVDVLPSEKEMDQSYIGPRLVDDLVDDLVAVDWSIVARKIAQSLLDETLFGNFGDKARVFVRSGIDAAALASFALPDIIHPNVPS